MQVFVEYGVEKLSAPFERLEVNYAVLPARLSDESRKAVFQYGFDPVALPSLAERAQSGAEVDVDVMHRSAEMTQAIREGGPSAIAAFRARRTAGGAA